MLGPGALQGVKAAMMIETVLYTLRLFAIRLVYCTRDSYCSGVGLGKGTCVCFETLVHQGVREPSLDVEGVR